MSEMTDPAEIVPDVPHAVVVRTLRFEIVWPGYRRTDLLPLWERIWKAQDDLRGAANRLMAALYQLKLGVITHPTSVPKKGGEPRPTPLRSLVYQGLSGAWQPFGAPLYVPTVDAVSSHALLGLAGTLYTRIQTDWTEIQRGNRALPTMRSIPIESPYVEVDRELGTFTFSLWAGRGGRVTVRPRKLDSRMWSELRRAEKFGGCRLIWDNPPGRKGRWMLAVAVTAAARDRSANAMVAAVRLGMATTCTLAYAEPAKGVVARFTDAIDLPGSAMRAVARVERERTERGKWNRLDHGQREGRGRVRKLRATEAIGDLAARVTDTAVRQTAAAVVAMAIRRGARAIALPDLARWSVASELDRTADLSESARTSHRRWYFRWHQGALREKIAQAAEREGLAVITVPPAGAGATCSECGSTERGRREGRRWECDCGCKLSVEANTAKVLARRALAE